MARTVKEALEFRARVVAAVRHFFDSRSFIEVDTPVRIAAPAPEPHIDCPRVGNNGFLRASPELQMKKLLAAGMERIYQIGPCFREGESGSRHSPEFTMLEWYRLEANFLDIKRDMEELLESLGAPGSGSFETISVREAYKRFALWDPWCGDWNQDRFDFDMATRIEPALKDFGGVFLTGYPPQCASLAKVEGGIAERWEFYWRGLEIANCFTELTDPSEQRRRFATAREERRDLGEDDYPIDEEFLASLALIPAAAGVAVGIDRLVMALGDFDTIAAVRPVS